MLDSDPTATFVYCPLAAAMLNADPVAIDVPGPPAVTLQDLDPDVTSALGLVAQSHLSDPTRQHKAQGTGGSYSSAYKTTSPVLPVNHAKPNKVMRHKVPGNLEA